MAPVIGNQKYPDAPCVSFNGQVACSDGEIGGARTGRWRQRRQAAGDAKNQTLMP
jgi:hypothetical protein